MTQDPSDDLDPLLAPLARLFVARGVPFRDFAERMKGHYLAAARTQIEAAGDKPTDSRLAVMTGLQRRDIGRLSAFEAKPRRATPLSQLVALWRTDPRYAPGGRPRPLRRVGDAPSFEALARGVRQDVHPRTFLDTLQAAGTVRVEDDQVHLVERAYVPLSGSEDQLAYLAGNVGDHLTAAVENVLADTPRFFERAVHYSGLTAEQAGALQTAFRKAQMALLEELSHTAAAMKEANAGEQAPFRFRAGGYVLTSDTTDPTTPEDT